MLQIDRYGLTDNYFCNISYINCMLMYRMNKQQQNLFSATELKLDAQFLHMKCSTIVGVTQTV
jgi:hypothetical protein